MVVFTNGDMELGTFVHSSSRIHCTKLILKFSGSRCCKINDCRVAWRKRTCCGRRHIRGGIEAVGVVLGPGRGAAGYDLD